MENKQRNQKIWRPDDCVFFLFGFNIRLLLFPVFWTFRWQIFRRPHPYTLRLNQRESTGRHLDLSTSDDSIGKNECRLAWIWTKPKIFDGFLGNPLNQENQFWPFATSLCNNFPECPRWRLHAKVGWRQIFPEERRTSDEISHGNSHHHIHSKYQLTKIYWLLTLTKRQELGGRLEIIENQMHRIVVQAIDEVDTVHGDEDRLE